MPRQTRLGPHTVAEARGAWSGRGAAVAVPLFVPRPDNDTRCFMHLNSNNSPALPPSRTHPGSTGNLAGTFWSRFVVRPWGSNRREAACAFPAPS